MIITMTIIDDTVFLLAEFDISQSLCVLVRIDWLMCKSWNKMVPFRY